MTIKQIRKALLGKYLHFTAEYRSEDTVWGGVVKKVEEERIELIPYFNNQLLDERNGIMPIPRDELETLVSEGHLIERNSKAEKIIYTQLLDNIPKDGDKRLVAVRYAISFPFGVSRYERMYYTIGLNSNGNTGICSKCSLNPHSYKCQCKKYRCSYLEKYELNK